jgi:sensor domain CHASE-containing protein
VHERQLKAAVAFLSALLAIMVVVVSIEVNLLHKRDSQYTYVPRDEPYVEEAARFWNIQSKEPAAAIAKDRFPVVIHIANETCVELRLYAGSLGGNPVYCFDQGRRLTRKFDQVE